MRSTLYFLTTCLLTLGAGCTALVEGTLAGRGGMDAGSPGNDTGPVDMGTMPVDAGPDGGPPSACAGLPDGVHCLVAGIDEPFVCLDGICQLSRCGDGLPDSRSNGTHSAEECDDGNATSGDGCEGDCTFSCHVDGDCDDAELCNGTETCGAMHTCEPGTVVPDSPPTVCMVGATPARCQGGVCRAGVCGDGTTDAGEECDDNNLNDGDGCDMDCTYSCTDDSTCQDGNACNGNEVCNAATHACGAATAPLECDDMDPCTTDTCDNATGCVNQPVLVDLDSDGHFAISASCGGDDCDDTNGNRYPGAAEPCGSATDLNCDGSVGTPPTWYIDCDRDGFAPTGGTSMSSCTTPAAPATCSSGSWTSVAPTPASHDCLDTSSSARPTQTAYFSANLTGLSPTFDYNCNASQERELSYAASGNTPRGNSSTCAFVPGHGTSICSGDAWYIATSTQACGASVSESHCEVRTISFPMVSTICTRVEETGYTVRCR